MNHLRTSLLAGIALLATPLVFAASAFAQPAQSAPGAQHMYKDKGMPMRGGMEGGGMGIVPPGTWWKSPETITSLTLTADQQKKLDDVFLQSRIGLIHLHASLEEEQLKLEPLLNSNPPDQAKTLAEISKIADLRADLEKADAKMLLSLRGVLTADQWTKLQADQRARRDHARSDDHSRDGHTQDDHSRDDHSRDDHGKRGPSPQGAPPAGPQGQGRSRGAGTPPPPPPAPTEE